MIKRLSLTLILSVLMTSAPAYAATCAMTSKEKDWVDRSLDAWEMVRTEHLKLAADPSATIILFDGECRFDANGATTAKWRPTRHGGKISLPDGTHLEVGVVSAAGKDPKTGERYFVMALPSVWEVAKIVKPDDWQGLTGVFLHEFSHIAQMPALEPAFDAAAAGHEEPEGLDDDRIQRIFQEDPAYVAVAEKERDLLFRAANEPDRAKARSLVRQALALRDARQKRWFIGDDKVWKAYDDLFLTMEGFGQWVAYAWLSDPQGGALTTEEAETRMRGGRKWWSQDQGLSAFLIIDRFVSDWPELAFAPRPVLAIDLLRLAVAENS